MARGRCERSLERRVAIRLLFRRWLVRALLFAQRALAVHAEGRRFETDYESQPESTRTNSRNLLASGYRLTMGSGIYKSRVRRGVYRPRAWQLSSFGRVDLSGHGVSAPA